MINNISIQEITGWKRCGILISILAGVVLFYAGLLYVVWNIIGWILNKIF